MMGRYLGAFFARIGITRLPFYQQLESMIATAAGAISGPAGLTVGAKLDWIIAGGIGAYLWAKMALTEEKRQAIENRIRTAPDVVYEWLHEASGVRPTAITEAGIKEWAGKVAALNINNNLGTNVVGLSTQADFELLIQQMQDELIAELVGSDNARYSMLDYEDASKMRRQVANVINRATGKAGLGGFTKLPTTRERMLNKIRQRRWRKKHIAGINYTHLLVDPTIDAIIVNMRNDIDAIKRGQYVPNGN